MCRTLCMTDIPILWKFATLSVDKHIVGSKHAIYVTKHHSPIAFEKVERCFLWMVFPKSCELEFLL